LTNDIQIDIYRNRNSYKSPDQGWSGRYSSLDVLYLKNITTGEIRRFTGVQTVSNSPDPDFSKWDTIAPGKFYGRYSYTRDSLTPSFILRLNGGKTIGGDVNNEKLWQFHSNRSVGRRADYIAKWSGGCIMLSSLQTTEVENILGSWGIQQGYNIPINLYGRLPDWEE
jgi:hypothetical protein